MQRGFIDDLDRWFGVKGFESFGEANRGRRFAAARLPADHDQRHDPQNSRPRERERFRVLTSTVGVAVDHRHPGTCVGVTRVKQTGQQMYDVFRLKGTFDSDLFKVK